MSILSAPNESPSKRVTCNPLDLSYRYQEYRLGTEQSGILRRTVYREAADPSAVRFRDRFYLFASMSAGFWHSRDLVTWAFQPTKKLPAQDYAPDVRVINDALYISASREGRDSPFYRSENPLEDDFIEVSSGFPFWDPNLFQDEDGGVYFYWGCSHIEPIRGVRMEPTTLAPKGEPQALIFGDPEHHGWEQLGENYVQKEPTNDMERGMAEFLGGRPYIEGAWMTEHDGTYYLQYSAPATENNTYADGYYTAPSPLGPFEYSQHSPFSSKPGGFITGAGHGSTLQDDHGNWWHMATMRISINQTFERRIGIFPAGFDDDGVLFCNQNFGDYPTYFPDRPADPWTDTDTGWMLQSFRAETSASTSLPGHGPELAVNEDIRSWWTAGTNEPGQWIQVDLGSARTVHAIQVNLADHELAELAPRVDGGWQSDYEYRVVRDERHSTGLVVEVSADGQAWQSVHDSRRSNADTPHLLITLEQGRSVRFVRVTGGSLPFDGLFAVSGLRVFGHGTGISPQPVHGVRVDRYEPRAVRLDWDAEPTAQGYNVRYGLAPDRLYHSWLVYEQTNLDLRALNAGVPYWVAIDAFNENGVTAGPTVGIG